MLNNLPYFLGWSLSGKIGPQRFKQLEKFFGGDWETSWRSGSKDLTQAGFSPKLVTELLEFKNNLDLELALNKIAQSGIDLLSIENPQYPPLLKQIFDPPFLLYTQGEIRAWPTPLAVVGSRNPSPYGRRAVTDLVSQLAQLGLTIVSGLALGVDSLAHEAALSSTGLTVAVLGSGLGQIYPASHRQLAEEILSSGGALISEYPPEAIPMKYCFPQRNRIIAGLSLGVLVIEGALQSGSLITAQRALENNREIMAVPGDIYRETSGGTNSLIQRGAKLITCAEDVLEVFDLQAAIEISSAKNQWQPENPTEKLIAQYLGAEPIHIDKLAELTKLDISLLNSTLSLLEITGKIKHLGGMNYVLNH